MTDTRPRVGLFVTCLVDLFRPSIGFAAAKLIEESGCQVEVPAAQTCCGQPAYNSGDSANVKALALQTVRAFEDHDYVVAPSGSCAAMLKIHYPQLFASEDEVSAEVNAFAGKVHELMSFLVNVRRMTGVSAESMERVTYHDSCSGLRELGVKSEPRRLLRSIAGLDLKEMQDSEVCCGFGGLFAVKYPDISNAMAETKIAAATASGADVLLAGDLGCLMHLAGTMKRNGCTVSCRHVAEVLANEHSDPPIAEAREPL